MSQKILVVEDDAALRSLFQNIVDSMGYTVTDVSSRVAAMDSLAENEYLMMVCDIEVDDGNMLDVIEVCCEHGLDVAVITSNEEYLPECRDLGVLAFIRKPIAARDLMTLIRDIDQLDLPGAYIRGR